jgi:drug/metabolite transporter (DMT)-like permease
LARQLRDEPLFKLSFSNSLFCLIVGVAGLWIGHTPKVEMLPSAYWQLPVLIVCSVCGALGALFAAQKLPPIRSALLCYLQIPLAVFFAWLWMRETITTQIAMGLILIIAGSLTAQLQRPAVRKNSV